MSRDNSDNIEKKKCEASEKEREKNRNRLKIEFTLQANMKKVYKYTK